MVAADTLEDLRAEWKTLYSETLPNMAKARDTAQPRWPVTLDHCFARIILDNIVGKGEQQWDKILPKPAIRNMDEQQLQDAVALGLRVIAGEVDLCQLDEASLRCRGKNQGKYAKTTAKAAPTSNGNRKRAADGKDEADGPASKQKKTSVGTQSTLDSWKSQTSRDAPDATGDRATEEKERQMHDREIRRNLDRIQSHPSLTPYRKRLYTILLSVPRGRYTTYAAMSEYLNSSARAVGNGMRNNPFAPDVPCHRVLAADGTIGGFHGDWGKDGKHASKKVEFLRNEGVRFDGKGKVVGQPFQNFHEFRSVEEDS